ncbi:MAG TPA: CdaR family protein [Terriglobales bacterium]|nr:CdaR family protein [Terriglobales bacterium]
MKELFQVYVLHNFGLKLISLALAVALWLAVSGQAPTEVAVDVPIEFQNIPANLEIGSENIPRAQVRLRGPERAINGLRTSDVRAAIDLTGAVPGQRTFTLTQNVSYPHELDVTQVTPTHLQLTFDTRLARQVAVHPRVVGTFADEYTIGNVQANPSVVTINGPRKRVEAVDAAITDPVDASGAVDQTTFVTHAYVSDPMVQVVNPGPIRVTINMQKAAPTGAPHKSE